MKIVVKWLILCAMLAIGEALAFYLPYFSSAWPYILVLALFVALIAFGFRWCYLYLVSILLLGVTVAWIHIAERREVLTQMVELNRGRPVEVEFKVPSTIKYLEDSKGVTKVTFPSSVHGVDVTVNIYIKDGEELPKPSEVWRCNGWLGRNSEGKIFGKRRFWVRGKGSSAKLVKKSDKYFSLARIVGYIRDDVSKRIGMGVESNGEIKNLNRALLLGDKSGISADMRKDFANSGTAHLFAVSGLHVFVIAKFFSILLCFTGFPVRYRAIPLLPLIWLYILVVGAGPSSVRAGIMATFYFLAPLFWRKGDSLVSWALTFILVHIVKPENLINTGSQLSFVVMLGLVVWNRIAKEFKGRIFSVLAPSFVAWAFGVPIVAATFDVITPGGLVANLLAVPVACLSVVLSASGVLVSYVSYFMASLLNEASYMMTSIMIGLARTTSSVGLANFEVEKWTFIECMLWYAIICVSMWAVYMYRTRVTIRI